MIHSRARATRGFTLVELMIVVAVVGVLAVVAYAGYRKFVAQSHMAEVGNILSGIKMREDAYRSETGVFLKATNGLDANQQSSYTNIYPHCSAGLSRPSARKVGWGASCTCCSNQSAWQKLKIETNGPVYFGYSLVAGDASAAPTYAVTMDGTRIAWPGTVTGPWFIATAVGDPNNNGIVSTAVLSSFDNEMRFDQEGE